MPVLVKKTGILFSLSLFLLINLHANPFVDLKIFELHEKCLSSYTEEINKNDTVFINNNIFYLPYGQYYYTVSQKYNEINDNFIKDIIGGNVFVLFNWVKGLMFQKTSDCIIIKFSQDELYNSKISNKLISLFDIWVGYFCSIIDNTIEINYDQFVSIDFDTPDDNTLYIHNFKGIEIKNKITLSDKLMGLLDVSRYKLLYHNNCVFLGIVNPDKVEIFDYYVYTSIEDIGLRGFAEVFEHSNEEIRVELKPLVKSFFE